MLLYNSCRIGGLLDLKEDNCRLKEQYFDVISSKTENGIRKIPIPDKLLPFYQGWYDRHLEYEYLLIIPGGKHFLYRNYKDSYYTTIMEHIGIKWSPHCTRHTTISMMKVMKQPSRRLSDILEQ
jgi:integrase